MDSSAKFEIDQLLFRAAHALDDHNLKMLEACFAPDAVLLLDIEGVAGTTRFEGREAIMKLMRDSVETQTDKRRHITTNTRVTRETDGEVSLLSNLTLTAVENGAIRLVTSGLYRDRVRCGAAGWEIIERHIDLDMPY